MLVNYNGLQDTLDCIESLLKTSQPELLNIIVVDNSTNRNEATLISNKFPKVQAIRCVENNGFSHANNLGIKEAIHNTCTHIMLLNNDTIVDKDMISILIRHSEENCILAPTILYYDDPMSIWSQAGHISKITGNAKNGKMNTPVSTTTPDSIECNFLSGCCMFMPMSTFNKIGILDESYFMYFEDADYCVRARKLGIKLKCITKAVLYHKVGKSVGGSHSAFCAYYLTRNRLNFLKKYKEYFGFIPYCFSLLTRIIRMIQTNDASITNTYKLAILDHLKNITGKTFL